MRALHKGLLLVPLFAAVVAAPAAAQSWKWDWGVNVGWSHFTNSLGPDQTGLADGATGSTVHFDNGILFGTQLGYWFSPKIGLRLNGRYADRDLEAKDFPNDLSTSVNLWGATADLMYRFKAPQPEFTSMEMLPYLALGIGAKWHNPAGDDFTCNDASDGKSFSCVPFTTSFNNGWALGEQNALAFLVGLGADWRLARKIALRTELSDQIFKPQIEKATVPTPTTSTTWTLPTGENEAKLTHELGIQVGLQFLFGLAAPPVVAVAPPPPPPPAPPPAPEVRRESINVCVVDPTAPGGIRMQEATLVEGKDTVISVGGTDRPFRESVGNVMVATNADWYVQGQPLTMTIGTSKAEFATYGTPRVVEANDLAYLGTVNGYPVYADKDDVADVVDELNDLNK
ncbi:MAG TPA: outer membrane beta-barrel protein, partial [Longimicrobiales bacterium]